MNYQEIIDTLYAQIKAADNSGAVADYIPELAKVNPDNFGICLTTVSGEQYGAGDWEKPFSIQSIAKVFSLTYAYSQKGGELWERLGVEPSGTAFNSLVQLESDNGIPRNPFINAGAMVVCDELISLLESPKEEFLAFLRTVSGNKALDYSTHITNSEKSVGYRNFALCNFLKSYGNIHNEVDEVIDFYFNLCSIEMNCTELSRTGLYLANHGRLPHDNTEILTISRTKRINAIMQTCGFYDESGDFAYRVGLPGKSGVGGGIMAIRPGQYSIVVWSPNLNIKGNSHRGMLFLEAFTTKTEDSIF